MASAGTAVSVLIKGILARLVDEENYLRSSAIQSKLKKLKKTLSEIQAVLIDASHKEVTHTAIRVWLNRLQDLCYDLDDLLDEVATKAMDRDLTHESKSLASKVRTLIPKLSLSKSLQADKLDLITTKLQQLEKQKDYLGLIGIVKDEKLKDTSRRNETSLLEFNVVGREGEKEKLLNKLLGNEPSKENFSIVPIVGMGGVGKTTLARVLYNEIKVKYHFQLMAWVEISDEFDVFEISKAIFQSLTEVKLGFEDLNQLQMALAKELKDKLFLLVLDDVWLDNYDLWENLVRPFHLAAPGSKIVMTTPHVRLLKKLDFEQIDHLQCLSHEDSLSLLALHALGVDNFDSDPTLRTLGEGIVKKCGGLPLALKTIGSLLSTKTYGEGWKDVLNSEIWELESDGEIVPALLLCYHDLSADLKWLFAYCSLFPKDFLFDKEKLVLLWLAEGYLNQSHANEFNESPERLGHHYFETLLSRSFFQHVPDHESLFVMHDLIHDLATFVARDSFSRFGDQMGIADEALARYCHMSFIPEQYVGYQKFEAFRMARRLRTLLVVGVDKSWNFSYLSNKILVDLLPELPLLRVLSLSNCNISEVPDFIGDLKHLRYLNLSQTKIMLLPENVGNLYYLQTLIISGCVRLRKLPKSFLKLKRLRHFDMRGTPLLKNVPSGIGELKNLQTLSKIIIKGDNGFVINDLKGLNNLHGELSIERLDKVEEPIHAREANLSLKGLTKLNLIWSDVFDDSRKGTHEMEVLNELKPNSVTLKELAIKSYGGIEFPNWVGHPSFHLLTDVSIIECRNCTRIPPLGSLLLLKKLLIKGMNEIRFIGSVVHETTVDLAFPTLEILVFEDMRRWEVWSTNGKAAFPCLRELQIKNCPMLSHVSLEEIPSLRILEMGLCGSGVLRSLVQTATSITQLKIENISGLTDEVWRGVTEHLGAVEEVSIIECNEMTYLWESEAKASTALVNLRKLEVFGCSNLVSLGEEEEEDNCRSNLLISLRDLEVWFCRNMKRCCCPYGIESLSISSCSSLTHVSFPRGGQKLKSLSLYGCHKLMEQINSTSMLMLEIMDIRRWSNLTSIIALGNFSNVTYLMIQECQSLKSFPDLMLPHLAHLAVGDCVSLESFPDHQLSRCTLLKHLEITNCPRIDASFPWVWPPNLCTLEIGGLKKPFSEWGPQNYPVSLVCLKLLGVGEHVSNFGCLSHLLPSSLTELHIQEFRELESLSMGLDHLTRVQHLAINDCPKMKKLPETLLPPLLKLDIYGCPRLKERCNERRSHYWPLISHIPCIHIKDGY